MNDFPEFTWFFVSVVEVTLKSWLVEHSRTCWTITYLSLPDNVNGIVPRGLQSPSLRESNELILVSMWAYKKVKGQVYIDEAEPPMVPREKLLDIYI